MNARSNDAQGRSSTAIGYVQVAVAAAGWGTWSLFLRPAHVDARWAATITLTMTALAGAPLLFFRAHRGPHGDGGPRRAREWKAIVGLGVFDAANAALFFAAMSVTSVAVAVLSHYLAPVLVAAGAPFVLGTPKKKYALLLALAALGGLALVLEPWKLGVAGAMGRPLLGGALGAASALFYAANVFITKKVGRRFTAEEQLVWHAVVSGVGLCALALVTHAPLPALSGAGRVALGGTLIGATSGLLFLRGLSRVPAEHAGLLTFLEPLVAVLVAWLVYDERPGLAAAVGGAVVLVAGVMAIRGGGNQ